MNQAHILGYKQGDEAGVPPAVVASFIKDIKDQYGPDLSTEKLSE